MSPRERQLNFLGPEPEAGCALPDGAVTLLPAFYGRREAQRLFDALRAEVDWQAESIRLFGETHLVPRLTAWHGDAGAAYMYSGIHHAPLPWTPLLTDVRRRVEAECGHAFNAVLLNRYRDGRDKMGWHADDEPELGPEPTIASLSLGVTRTFQMRHRTRKELARVDFELSHGSLLIMRPPTQTWWLHKVPARAAVHEERINLTFRLIHA